MKQTVESMRWPRTLFGRISLILFSALLMAHALSFSLSQWEKMQFKKNFMVYSCGKDVANAVAFLDRLPTAQRPSWLDRLARTNYQYALQAAPADAIENRDLEIAQSVIKAVQDNLEHTKKITSSLRTEADKKILQLHFDLADGTPLTIRLSETPFALQWSKVLLVCLQLAILVTATSLAVGVATRPLAMLANAADAIVKPGAGPEVKAELPACAPQEVYRAATAFQNMQQRIDSYLAERMQILAAIAHDLQTPITRMRLRTEFMEDDIQRNKMQADLHSMQKLVEQGLAYAQVQNHLRTKHEAISKIALDALIDSMVQDYCDTGQQVRLTGQSDIVIDTQPQALTRLLGNLIDNALKFGQEAEVVLGKADVHHVFVTVQDRGPGIPQDQWEAVMQPFVRLEISRNRDTGGAGLGLAIVRQLALLLNAQLQFANREDGGFAVTVRLAVKPETVS